MDQLRYYRYQQDLEDLVDLKHYCRYQRGLVDLVVLVVIQH